MSLDTFENILKSIDNPNWTVRSSTVTKLAELNHEKAFETILQVLKTDKHKYVRQKCVEVLTKLKRKDSVDTLIDAVLNDDYSYVRELSATALAEIGDLKAVGPIMQAVTKHSNQKKYQFINALGKLADIRALDLIIGFLDSSDKVMIYSVAHALENFPGEEKAVKALIQYLEKSKNDTDKAYVMDALGAMKTRTAIPAILKSYNNLLKHNVVSALNKIGDFDYYLKLLQDNRIQIQIVLVQALQNSGLKIVFDTLLVFYKKTKSKQLKLEIIKRLFEFPGEKECFKIEDRILYYVAIKDKKSINALDKSAEDELIKLISLRDTEQKVLVFDALADIKSEKAVPYLVKYLCSKSERLQTRAAYNLGRIGHSSTTLPLIEALQVNAKRKANYDQRQDIVAALGSIGDCRAIDPLNQLLNELLSNKITNDHFVSITINSLVRLKSNSSNGLMINALRSNRLSVRKAAANAITRLNYGLTEQEKVYLALALQNWESEMFSTEIAISTLIKIFNKEPLTIQKKMVELFCKNKAKEAAETVAKWLYFPSISMSEDELQKSIPLYTNLFGKYTETILYTAVYLNCESKQHSTYTFEYQYDFKKSFKHIEKLENDTSQIGSNLLFLLKEKGFLDLLVTEHEEYYSHYEKIHFKEQNLRAKQALSERAGAVYKADEFLEIM